MTDIVERLRQIADSDFIDDRESIREAADTIERLRFSLEATSGTANIKAGRGQSFAEITKDMKHRDASYEPSVGRDSATGGG